MSLRTYARKVRDNPVVNPLLRSPFLAMKRCGIAIPKRVYQHLVYRGPVQVESPGGGRFTMIARGHQIENNLYWTGLSGHEPECMLPWVYLAQNARVVLDIGANTGVYALAAACQPSLPEVHAFEPVPRIAARLRENAEANPRLKITVHECAVGAEPGTAEFYDPGGDNCYSASLSADFLTGRKETYPVRVTTVDALVEEAGLPSVDLIKLDVEGCEELALAGMPGTLAHFRPTVLMEVLKYRPPLWEHLERFLADGYDLYWPTGGGLLLAGGLREEAVTDYALLQPREKPLPSAVAMHGAMTP
jgi:FkbM family methyltransferase